MPVTYEYRCGCEHRTTLRVEVDQRDDKRTCDTCSKPMQRIYSVPGISFKGEGWGGKP
jgi:putative FmdB family regulatory protein